MKTIRALPFLFFLLYGNPGKSQFTIGEGMSSNNILNLSDSSYISIEETIKIYPNPSNDLSVVQLNSAIQPGGYEVYISDLYGTLKRKIIIYNPRRILISRDNLPPGIYYCRILSPDLKVYSTRFIIQ
jgi:hypothetical protein